MGWSDERVDVLKKLWLDGLSATQIAKQLGSVTRNAVIGKVHRLGMAGRAQPSKPTRPVFKAPRPPRTIAPMPARPHVTSAPIEPKFNRPLEEPLPPPRIEAPGSATTLTLGTHMCKWPIGDPMADEFTYCGRRADGVYCIDHARMAYQPSRSSSKRKSDNGLTRLSHFYN